MVYSYFYREDEKTKTRLKTQRRGGTQPFSLKNTLRAWSLSTCKYVGFAYSEKGACSNGKDICAFFSCLSGTSAFTVCFWYTDFYNFSCQFYSFRIVLIKNMRTISEHVTKHCRWYAGRLLSGSMFYITNFCWKASKYLIWKWQSRVMFPSIMFLRNITVRILLLFIFL